jgi:hypothetical protein
MVATEMSKIMLELGFIKKNAQFKNYNIVPQLGGPGLLTLRRPMPAVHREKAMVHIQKVTLKSSKINKTYCEIVNIDLSFLSFCKLNFELKISITIYVKDDFFIILIDKN